MPISSGANNWPNKYFNPDAQNQKKVAPKQRPPRVGRQKTFAREPDEFEFTHDDVEREIAQFKPIKAPQPISPPPPPVTHVVGTMHSRQPSPPPSYRKVVHVIHPPPSPPSKPRPPPPPMVVQQSHPSPPVQRQPTRLMPERREPRPPPHRLEPRRDFSDVVFTEQPQHEYRKPDYPDRETACCGNEHGCCNVTPIGDGKGYGPCGGGCVGLPCWVGGYFYPRGPRGPTGYCCEYNCKNCCSMCCTGGFWEPVDALNKPAPLKHGGCCGAPYEFYREKPKKRCKRCCVCSCGIILILLVAGAVATAFLYPELSDYFARVRKVENTYPGAYYRDGVVYIPYDDRERIYANIGEGDIQKCWELWSSIKAITTTVPRVFRTQTTTIPSSTTNAPPAPGATAASAAPTPLTSPAYTQYTYPLPDCLSLTTRYDFVRIGEVDQTYRNVTSYGSGNTNSIQFGTILWVSLVPFLLAYVAR